MALSPIYVLVRPHRQDGLAPLLPPPRLKGTQAADGMIDSPQLKALMRLIAGTASTPDAPGTFSVAAAPGCHTQQGTMLWCMLAGWWEQPVER